MNARKRRLIITTANKLQRKRVYEPWTDYERALLTAANILQTAEYKRNESYLEESMRFGVEKGHFSQQSADRILQ